MIIANLLKYDFSFILDLDYNFFSVENSLEMTRFFRNFIHLKMNPDDLIIKFMFKNLAHQMI